MKEGQDFGKTYDQKRFLLYEDMIVHDLVKEANVLQAIG